MNQPQTETTTDIDLDNLDPRALCNAGAWVPLKVGSIPAGLDIKIRGRFSDVFEKLSRAEQRRIAFFFYIARREHSGRDGLLTGSIFRIDPLLQALPHVYAAQHGLDAPV